MNEGLDLVTHMPTFQIGKARLRGAGCHPRPSSQLWRLLERCCDAPRFSTTQSVQRGNSKKPSPKPDPLHREGCVWSGGQSKRLEPLSPAPLSPVTQ